MNALRQRPTWSLLAGTLAAMILAACYWPKPAEPAYEGFPLSYYLENQTYGELRREREAAEAIRAIGSNAVPPLIRVLTQRESRLTGAFRDWMRQHSWGRRWQPSLALRQRQALLACQTLGTLAAPAVPALTGLSSDPELASLAVRALAFAGPQTFPLLTNLALSGVVDARVEAAGDLRYFEGKEGQVAVLLQALTDPHPAVRARAAGTLGVIHADPATVIPALTRCLEDDHPEVVQTVIASLSWFGADAASAVPALRQLQNESLDPQRQEIIGQTLREIGAQPGLEAAR